MVITIITTNIIIVILMNKKAILITGCAGFYWIPLGKNCVLKNYNIIGLDNLMIIMMLI